MSRIFGIDLGTTNSLIAVMDHGAPCVLGEPSSGEALLPSVVAIGRDGQFAVGAAAVALEANGDDGAQVIRSVKRYMGLGGEDLAAEARRRYGFADACGPVLRFRAGARSLSAALSS